MHWTPQLSLLSLLIKPSSAGNELDSWPGRDDGSAFRTLGVVRLDVRQVAFYNLHAADSARCKELSKVVRSGSQYIKKRERRRNGGCHGSGRSIKGCPDDGH